MFDDNGELMNVPRYLSQQPSFSIIGPGVPVPISVIAIYCDIESDIFYRGGVGATGAADCIGIRLY